ncbi:hypothetical protein DFH28DRAFT_975241 [Melampsora americana]|nr:hypothetical protein DFH28DRAFT_975241 [Melampsora americana]
MGFGFNGVEGEALFNQLSSSNPELQPSRILGMTLYTIQNMDYELPKIGLVEIENHRSLGEAMNSWFQVLTQKVQINLQSLSIPQGEKDVIWPKLLFAIKGANVKLTTSFLVCLKFSYLKDPLELHDLYSSGWKFISDIMDGWGTINLKEVLKTEFGSLSKQNQQLNSSFLLSYMLTLQSKAPISLMTLWKICGSWQNQLPNQEDRFKPELTFQDFSKNVLAGVIQAACLTKNSGQKPQIGLNPNTSSGEMINQTQKQTHTAELLDNPHRYQHPHVSSNHRKVDRAILQAQSVGESMIKSSGFNQLPDKWFLDLSVKVKNKANQVYPLSSFHFTEKDLEWAIKTTQNYITPAFLGIIILLHPKITDPVERNMLALNGWSFLKHYMEGWKGYSLEEAVQLSLPKITEFYKHPKPSVLLRYLMRINVNCTTRIPTSMLWGLWLAWVEWDGCIVTNKIYIASYKSFRQLLDQEAMINLSRPSLPMLG